MYCQHSSGTPVKLYLDTERSMELSGLDAYSDLRENTWLHYDLHGCNLNY